MSNESTPFLIGLDVIREYGLVIDCHTAIVSAVTSCKITFFCTILPTGHLALEMMPEQKANGSSAKCRVKPSRLGAGANNQGQRRKERFHLNQPRFIFVKMSQNTSTNTSTSEDDLLKLLGIPEDTQTWTRFDKRAKTCRATSSSEPL